MGLIWEQFLLPYLDVAWAQEPNCTTNSTGCKRICLTGPRASSNVCAGRALSGCAYRSPSLLSPAALSDFYRSSASGWPLGLALVALDLPFLRGPLAKGLGYINRKLAAA
jgi:hypothetical protein